MVVPDLVMSEGRALDQLAHANALGLEFGQADRVRLCNPGLAAGLTTYVAPGPIGRFLGQAQPHVPPEDVGHGQVGLGLNDLERRGQDGAVVSLGQ
jgi:hypothetical protein